MNKIPILSQFEKTYETKTKQFTIVLNKHGSVSTNLQHFDLYSRNSDLLQFTKLVSVIKNIYCSHHPHKTSLYLSNFLLFQHVEDIICNTCNTYEKTRISTWGDTPLFFDFKMIPYTQPYICLDFSPNDKYKEIRITIEYIHIHKCDLPEEFAIQWDANTSLVYKEGMVFTIPSRLLKQ